MAATETRQLCAPGLCNLGHGRCFRRAHVVRSVVHFLWNCNCSCSMTLRRQVDFNEPWKTGDWRWAYRTVETRAMGSAPLLPVIGLRIAGSVIASCGFDPFRSWKLHCRRPTQSHAAVRSSSVSTPFQLVKPQIGIAGRRKKDALG